MEVLMKTRFGPQALAVGAIAVGVSAASAHAESFMQWASVVRTTPIYVHLSEPRQQCWTERVTSDEYVDRNGIPLGAIVGGITGGVIGNQIGSGSGRDVATVGGAIAGAALGNALDWERAGITLAPVTRDVERCRTVDVGRDVLDGYDVTYRYLNRDFTTRLPYDPGERLQLRVAVEPQVRE
jgi:uncharacterized protein YcfJ